MTFRRRLLSILGWVLWRIEKIFEKASLVEIKPFYDVSDFEWVEEIEKNWKVIREELDEVMQYQDDLPSFHEISPDQGSISKGDDWKTFFLYAYGFAAEGNIKRCPNTNKVLQAIPGMKTAFFSILAPNKQIPPHRGPFKGVLRYHLGLQIPEQAEECGIRVDEEVRHWENGKSLIFDDTFDHEAWNNTDEYRVILFVDFERPMKGFAKNLNKFILKGIQYSPLVSGAKGNYNDWEKEFEKVTAKS